MLLLAGTAGAQGAATLYAHGAFAESYRIAVASDTVASQTLAAKAAVAFALYAATSDSGRLAWFQRASDAAERAVALDPRAVNALLVLAEAKGKAALLKGALQNLGVAGETRDLLQRVLAVQPDNANALVGLGIWNLELTDRGVGWMFGARRKGALAMVERGIEHAPDDIELRIEYGRALTLVGDDAGARAQFRAAMRLPARSAVDRLQQRRARGYLDGASGAP